METKQNVKDAILEFYKTNNFDTDGGKSKNLAWIKFGIVSIPIPNFESRKKNVYYHDINHLITDNDTSWKGESAVAAWEIASGGWNEFYIIWLLTLWAMGLGVLFYKKTTFLSFKKGLFCQNSLTSKITVEEMDKLSVEELKSTVSNKIPRVKSYFFWSICSVLVFLSPFVIGILTIFYMINYFTT